MKSNSPSDKTKTDIAWMLLNSANLVPEVQDIMAHVMHDLQHAGQALARLNVVAPVATGNSVRGDDLTAEHRRAVGGMYTAAMMSLRTHLDDIATTLGNAGEKFEWMGQRAKDLEGAFKASCDSCDELATHHFRYLDDLGDGLDHEIRLVFACKEHIECQVQTADGTKCSRHVDAFTLGKDGVWKLYCHMVDHQPDETLIQVGAKTVVTIDDLEAWKEYDPESDEFLY